MLGGQISGSRVGNLGNGMVLENPNRFHSAWAARREARHGCQGKEDPTTRLKRGAGQKAPKKKCPAKARPSSSLSGEPRGAVIGW